MHIYNTLTRQLEEFKPIHDLEVLFYHCGPTVYWTQHIGNLRGMLAGDIIRRTFEYLGYSVQHVRNYTDVGHLVSDGDEGEDKMEKGAKREGKTPDEIAAKYIAIFEQDTAAMNLLEPQYKPRPSKLIPEVIRMVETLIDRGYAYVADLAVYYDVSKFAGYTQLSGQKISEQQAHAGKGDVEDQGKRQAADFALWFFKKGKHANALQTWESPWGVGFPGWHIECSVMSKKHLGDTIDLHMGGVEHIAVHHTNEIAQSEAANGVKFVNYWIHNEHLLVNGSKMAKSEGTGYALSEIIDKGFSPMDLRYFFLQAHYRSQQNFTWEALGAAASARQNLLAKLFVNQKLGTVLPEWDKRFKQALEADFNAPEALSLVWELIDSSENPANIYSTIISWDRVLGLNLAKSLEVVIPSEIEDMAKQRQALRADKDYQGADKVREAIAKAGYLVEDTASGYSLRPAKF